MQTQDIVRLLSRKDHLMTPSLPLIGVTGSTGQLASLLPARNPPGGQSLAGEVQSFRLGVGGLGELVWCDCHW